LRDEVDETHSLRCCVVFEQENSGRCCREVAGIRLAIPVAVARGLMAKPGLLLLDEPSLGLAPVIVRAVVRIISEIRRADHGLARRAKCAHGTVGCDDAVLIPGEPEAKIRADRTKNGVPLPDDTWAAIVNTTGRQ
jgi:hypothetical protein